MAKKLETLLKDDKFEEGVKSLNFEDGMTLLEELVSRAESGRLPLEQTIKSYEVGSAMIDHLRELLEGAEKKLQVLEKGA